MMTVNAFWFGFLIAVVVVMVLLLAVAFATARRNDEEDIEMSPEEYKAALEQMTGKPIRVYRDKNGYLVGEAIEDPDDDESNSKPN